jgi:putative copper resistance protein D
VGDWTLIVLRWALYADLGILFGLPLLWASAIRQSPYGLQSPHVRFSYGALAAVGIVASLLGFVWQAAGMAGTLPSEVNANTLFVLVSETSLGWALIARLAALALVTVGAAVSAVGLPKSRVLLPVCAGVALASLAWSGHAAADEGLRGWIHLIADVVHLLAAGAWLGALAGFVWLVAKSGKVPAQWTEVTHRALAHFSNAGTALVSLLVLTGILNFYFTVGLGPLDVTPYIQLLVLKLVLFVGMLGLAGVNRFRLTPALAAAGNEASHAHALRNLRRSLALEFTLGLAIVALVAWFGTLSPQVAL